MSCSIAVVATSLAVTLHLVPLTASAQNIVSTLPFDDERSLAITERGFVFLFSVLEGDDGPKVNATLAGNIFEASGLPGGEDEAWPDLRVIEADLADLADLSHNRQFTLLKQQNEFMNRKINAMHAKLDSLAKAR